MLQGNLTFGVDGDVTLIENTKLVSVIKDLLSTKEENVQKAMLYRTVATGRDVIEKQHTTQEASYGRDALAKVISGHQFWWPFCVCVVFFCSSTKEIKATEVYMCLQDCDISLVALCYLWFYLS